MIGYRDMRKVTKSGITSCSPHARVTQDTGSSETGGSFLSSPYSTKWGLLELDGSEDFHMYKKSLHKFTFIQYFLLLTPHSFTYFDDCFVVASILLSYILGFLSIFLLLSIMRKSILYQYIVYTIYCIPILPCLSLSLFLSFSSFPFLNIFIHRFNNF